MKTKRPCQKNNALQKMQAKKAVSGKTKKDDNRQSMIGTRRESRAEGEMGVRLVNAANLGLCKRNFELRTRYHMAVASLGLDEVLTFPAEAALENAQIDKAMAAMGIAQNLKEEENVTVARGGGSTSVQAGLRQATSQGLFAASSKTAAG